MPMLSKFALTAGSRRAVTVSMWIFSTIVRDVLPGTKNANHPVTSKPRTPASAALGRSGANWLRLAVVTASPRTWPLLLCSSIALPPICRSTRPAIVSVSAGAFGVGAGDRRGRDVGAAARLVLNHHLLAPDPRQPVGSDAGDRVGRSARRIRDDNAHGAGWPVLRQRWTAHRGRKRQRRGEWPRSCGAANRGYEFSPIDMDCHVTLRWGSSPCNGGTIPRFDSAVCGSFALGISDLAEGSFTSRRHAADDHGVSAMPPIATKSTRAAKRREVPIA